MRFDASEHEKSVATGIFPDFAALTVAVASTIPEPRGWVGLLGENGCTFCWIRVRISAVVKGLGATDCASATTVQLEEKRVPHGATTVGIDLGLKTMATYSDGTEFAPQKWYRESEQAPGIAQRAKKKRRVKAIHARIANQRKDAIHKETTALVKKHAAIFVGDVNAKALAKTGMAKSVHDAAWTTFRTQLRYKAIRQCVVFAEVNEAFSTQTVRAAGPFPPAVRKVGQGLE
jgi:IS605 OrfB family transposase